MIFRIHSSLKVLHGIIDKIHIIDDNEIQLEEIVNTENYQKIQSLYTLLEFGVPNLHTFICPIYAWKGPHISTEKIIKLLPQTLLKLHIYSSKRICDVSYLQIIDLTIDFSDRDGTLNIPSTLEKLTFTTNFKSKIISSLKNLHYLQTPLDTFDIDWHLPKLEELNLTTNKAFRTKKI